MSPNSSMKNRFDDLNGDDPIIRRLEMIRLLRSGRPVDEIASAYNAEPQYIFRLDELFSRSGTLGILTEDDFLSYRSLNPEHIRICSFNLHGI
ncbi:MAG: helix-turn-helix domain-containing protein, partial [Syntrophales bacterium LBB04]|nr:helix-turn-helix domain-containing protein [Syntrophales bacterium LBB04]